MLPRPGRTSRGSSTAVIAIENARLFDELRERQAEERTSEMIGSSSLLKDRDRFPEFLRAAPAPSTR